MRVRDHQLPTHTARRGTAILAVVALAIGCNTSASLPTAPSPSPADVATVVTAVCSQDASPPPRVYAGVESPESPYHGGALASRYLLCSDQTFCLQYSSPRFPLFEYRGTYVEADGMVTFRWRDNQGIQASWGPTFAKLTGDHLWVRYDTVMQLDGFEDGLYVLVQ